MTIRRVALLLLVMGAPARVFAANCESLAAVKLPATTVTMAHQVEAGRFTLPSRGPATGAGRGGLATENPFQTLPAFCRVALTLAPSSDSDIKVEVWLPLTGWNGNYQAVGNGGWAGTINYASMAAALGRGYATSSTDTGHSTPGGAFVVGHPEKYIDYAYRSVHEMALVSKAIVKSFYDGGPRYSYWNGCSTGGRQGLSEAQRFPDDFDGISAGAPANPRTHLGAWHMWLAHAALKEPASAIPATLFPVIHRAVIDKCDALDEVTDGVVSNPPACKFDPATIACGAQSTTDCLTQPQVATVRKLLSAVTNPRTGQEIYPGWEPGSELLWGVGIAGPDPFSATLEHFRYIVFKDPKWDWRTFDFDKDWTRAVNEDNNTINAIDPNLTKFQSRGGKLLLYHGWSDTNVAPQSTVRYYDSVVNNMGGAQKTADWVRLFMLPGMGHCGGGDGPNTFDVMPVLEQWVEKGIAPDRIVASRTEQGKTVRTRPVCTYPQIAVYHGTGSTDDAANFSCRAPR